MKLRCKHCNKLLAEKVTPPYRITCPRCHTCNEQEQVPILATS